MLQSARQWIGSWFQGKRKHDDDEEDAADQNKRARLAESDEQTDRVYCVRIANIPNLKKFPRILRREGYYTLKNHPKGVIYVAAKVKHAPPSNDLA